MTQKMKAGNSNLPQKIVKELTKTLEISESMYKDAEKKYNAIGNWLGESSDPLLYEAHIYPQGSVRLGTVVKPIGQDEFDIDLVIHLPNATKEIDSNIIHKAIGDRLKEHDTYKKMVSPLKRGWRINYKSSFHLDITPAVENSFPLAHFQEYTTTAEYVPDIKLQDWKDSNPRGYANWFDDMDKLIPNFVQLGLEERTNLIAKDHKIDNLPNYDEYKGILKRVVQLLKRHRDVYFNERDTQLAEFKPISIVLTTLAAESYGAIVASKKEYICPYSLMVDIIKNMSHFIEDNGSYNVVNPTNIKENFAEKWNTDSNYALAFSKWQSSAYLEVKKLQEVQGLDSVYNTLEESYGKTYAIKVRDALNTEVNDQRNKGLLASGILSGTEVVASVNDNRFFGAH
jgi:hypothetical protein